MAINSKKAKNKSALALFQNSEILLLNRRVAGRILIFLGLFLICTIFLLTQLGSISPQKKQVIFESVPSEIYVSGIEFKDSSQKLEVKKGTFQFNSWKIDENYPVYLDLSGVPGQPGNIVIYGHNKKEVFGNLHKLKKDEQIILYSSTGDRYVYKIDSIKQVFPNQVEVLQQGKDQRITLFTCTGILDSMRLVVTGNRV